MQALEEGYNNLCNSPSDINEHLPTLYAYATDCTSAIETGVRDCVSTWAISYGLLSNLNGNTAYLLTNDIVTCDIGPLMNACHLLPITFKGVWKNNLELDYTDDLENRMYDMVFIDTWNVYGQLKRELEKFSPIISKYIIMHDTTIDEVYGETIRYGWSAEEQSQQTGIPVAEIIVGLGPAITDFLAEHPEWTLKEKYTNNNGLTILERV